jgi:membrane protein insertase Oxa1/YidC/SpoIIIJ
MKKLFTFFLLAVLTTALTAPAFAKSKNTYTQPTNLHKAEKKQAKAQKKYAKQQKKAEKKMLKTSKKNTHYPPQAFWSRRA